MLVVQSLEVQNEYKKSNFRIPPKQVAKVTINNSYGA